SQRTPRPQAKSGRATICDIWVRGCTMVQINENRAIWEGFACRVDAQRVAERARRKDRSLSHTLVQPVEQGCAIDNAIGHQIKDSFCALLHLSMHLQQA